MIFEHIEKLKGDYTDKYVVVDEARPELRRFRNMTGTVRTVNMNGHALVEFDEYNNIAWYDINLDYLKVIDKPLPKPEKSAAKPAAKKEPAAKKPAAKAGGKSSTADILAMARGGGKPAEKDTAAKDTGAMSTADKLAALRGGGAPAAKKEAPAAPNTAAPDTAAMSTADKMAMLRGGRAPAKQKAAPAAEEPATEEPVAEQPAAEESASEESAAPSTDRPAPGSLSTDEILAWCRTHDAS